VAADSASVRTVRDTTLAEAAAEETVAEDTAAMDGAAMDGAAGVHLTPSLRAQDDADRRAKSETRWDIR
jgi:hypothetical protein